MTEVDADSVQSLDDLERDIDACVQLIASKPSAPKQAWTEPAKAISNKITNRLQRWEAERRAIMERREELRRCNEERLMSQCTFRPQLDANTSCTITSDEPVHERLLRRQIESKAEIEARRQQKSRLDQTQFTFRPNINRRSRALLEHRAPIYQRTNELQREAIYKREMLKAQYDHEASAELTFRPEMNRTSVQLMRRRRRQEQMGAVPPRPRTPATSSDYDDELRFRPEINDISRRLVHQLQISNRLPVDFVQRQMTFMEQRQTSLLQRQQSPSSHRPTTNNADVILRNTPHGRNDHDPFVRMSKVDSERRNQKQNQEQIREQFYSQFEFAPKINRRSRVLAGSRSENIDDRLSNDRAREARHKMRIEIEEKRRAECSFKPQLSAIAQSSQGLYTFSDPVVMSKRIQQYTASKEAKLEAARKALEREQLKECSFTPAVNGEVQSGTEIVVVRGLNRFLELKQLCEKQKEEKAQREQDAFRVKHADKYRVGNTTVMKPFSFRTSTLKRQISKDRLVKDVEKAHKQVCTFQPETISSKQKELINRILNDITDHDNGL